MLTIQAEPYMSIGTLWFQRLTVILTELLLFAAIVSLNSRSSGRNGTRGREGGRIAARAKSGSCLLTSSDREELLLGVVSTAFNGGLLIVDHIHFQYNGFLLGVLLLAASNISKGRIFLGAVLFTCLLNLKHIFLYVAPVFGLYLLRSYCIVNEVPLIVEGQKNGPATAALPTEHQDENNTSAPGTPLQAKFKLSRFCSIGLVVCLVCCASTFPVIRTGRVEEMISRLFPFGRGLVHAYWAPNLWALYLVLDRTLLAILKAIEGKIGATGLVIGRESLSPTAGMTRVTTTAVLPNVTPLVALCAVAILYYPVLKLCWIVAAYAGRRSRFQWSSAPPPFHETGGNKTVDYGQIKLRRRHQQSQLRCDSAATPDRRGAVTSFQASLFVTLLAMGSGVVFLAGWHVHEKAILAVTIPLGISVWKFRDPVLVRSFFWLNTIANFCLLPLMHSKSAPMVILKYGIFFASTLIGGACVLYHTEDRKATRGFRHRLTAWCVLVKFPDHAPIESFIASANDPSPNKVNASSEDAVLLETFTLRRQVGYARRWFLKVTMLVADLYLPGGIAIVGCYDIFGGVLNVGLEYPFLALLLFSVYSAVGIIVGLCVVFVRVKWIVASRSLM
eukprot:GHVS01089861.1.p1 GENE.GHVS01089861.1~~GHVS01089861.1.p1  ORF type:complete len:617 (+),score=26.03 GHVS01089861.1:746-2596(+)